MIPGNEEKSHGKEKGLPLGTFLKRFSSETQCHHQATVTARTVLHKTHMPLTQWFLAFDFVSQDKRGISAMQLAAMLGTTYKTAWSMLRHI